MKTNKKMILLGLCWLMIFPCLALPAPTPNHGEMELYLPFWFNENRLNAFYKPGITGEYTGGGTSIHFENCGSIGLNDWKSHREGGRPLYQVAATDDTGPYHGDRKIARCHLARRLARQTAKNWCQNVEGKRCHLDAEKSSTDRVNNFGGGALQGNATCTYTAVYRP